MIGHTPMATQNSCGKHKQTINTPSILGGATGVLVKRKKTLLSKEEMTSGLFPAGWWQVGTLYKSHLIFSPMVKSYRFHFSVSGYLQAAQELIHLF